MHDDEHEDYLLWRRTVEELLATGKSMADAVKEAPLIVIAQREKRDEARTVGPRQSGKLKRPGTGKDDDEGSKAG